MSLLPFISKRGRAIGSSLSGVIRLFYLFDFVSTSFNYCRTRITHVQLNLSHVSSNCQLNQPHPSHDLLVSHIIDPAHIVIVLVSKLPTRVQWLR